MSAPIDKNVQKFSREFGEKIRKLRFFKKMSQLDLAKLARISRSSLAHIELGNHMPSVFTAAKLAKAFKIKLDKLLP